MLSEIHLIYTSRATALLNASELDALASISGERNAALGITGVLLIGGGRFFQVLEGQADAVKDLYYNRIAHDTRHDDCQVLASMPCVTRLFPGWSMGRLYMQQGAGVAQQSWDALCVEIARQNPQAVFAREPAVCFLKQFIEQFDGQAGTGWQNNQSLSRSCGIAC